MSAEKSAEEAEKSAERAGKSPNKADKYPEGEEEAFPLASVQAKHQRLKSIESQ
jgi:hypothetical protein